MQAIALLALVACVLTLVVTPLVRALSIAAGWLDRPDQQRKFHARAIPRTGGVAVMLSYAGACAAVLWLAGAGSAAPVLRLLPGAGVIFLVGLLDDRFDLKPWHKLAAELAGALWVCAAGVRLAVAGQPVWWGWILTVAWLVLCANAFNLIDGMDGLAAGVGLTASIAILSAGALHGNAAVCIAAAPLVGALLGFLRYNFHPATIFLGDSGSLSIGFLLGACSLMWSGRPAPLLSLAAPAMALALPLLDVALSIVRRFLRNDPIFAGDRGHIHHRLLDRGHSPRSAALVLYAAGTLGAALALYHATTASAVALALFVVFACAGVRYLGYAEFRAATRFVRQWLRPVLGAHVRLEVFERSLRTARGPAECWSAIESAGIALGYSRIEARLNGARFSSGGPRRRESWQMRVNLAAGDYVNVAHYAGALELPRQLAGFVDVLTRILPSRLIEERPRPDLFPHPAVRRNAPGDRDHAVA